MTPRTTASDVVLTYGPTDDDWAADVYRRLGAAGLKVFRVGKDDVGRNSSANWRGHTESYSFILLISEASVSPEIDFEIGAAMAWEKPIFAIYKRHRPTTLPKYVERCGGIYPAEQIDEVVALASAAARPLSERERQILVKTYDLAGIPIDELLREPEMVDRLIRQFNRAAKSSLSSHRFLQELIRMSPRLRRTFQKQHA